MAKAGPRWKRDLPRRLPPRRGARRAASGSRARRYAAKAAGRACGLRRYPAMAPGALAGAPRNPPRQRRGSRPVPTSRARPRVPTSRRRARRPCPGDGHQVQPGTSMRSSASDDPHRSVVGRSGRLGAQSHLICMPQDADRHDAAIGADRAVFAHWPAAGSVTVRDHGLGRRATCRLWAGGRRDARRVWDVPNGCAPRGRRGGKRHLGCHRRESARTQTAVGLVPSGVGGLVGGRICGKAEFGGPGLRELRGGHAGPAPL